MGVSAFTIKILGLGGLDNGEQLPGLGVANDDVPVAVLFEPHLVAAKVLEERFAVPATSQ